MRALLFGKKHRVGPPVPISTAGIYHNATLGIISLSGDGIDWITIADKNLGATQVWNDGDVLSEVNCGKYYQWGNNYGFPRDGNLTTVAALTAQATNYGPYYDSDVFIKGSNSWTTGVNPNLWGGVTGTKKAMKGPCDEGYHIPKDTEFANLKTLLTSLGLNTSTGADIRYYLKMPFTGRLMYINGGATEQDTIGHYWTTIASSNNQAYNLNIDGTQFNTTVNGYMADGRCIRPFRNTPITLDTEGVVSSVKTYNGSFISQDAGIYEFTMYTGETVISITVNGTDWITIADRNLGATQAYNYGDTLSEVNCGGYFQWGNNHMFPFIGPTNTSTSSTQVDATNYGPYWNNTTFRINTGGGWESTGNLNLWGGVTGTNRAMQGPCPEGFHVPSKTEWDAIITLAGTQNRTSGDYVTRLKLPLAGALHGTSGWNTYEYNQGVISKYWTSTTYNNTKSYYYYNNGSATSVEYSGHYTTEGCSIRPFKNTPVVPTSSRIVLYQPNS